MKFLEKHPELIRLADPRNGVTPLHKAAAFLLQPMAAWLLDRGADANALNRIGNTPLDVVGCARSFGTAEQVAAMTGLCARGAERTARRALTTGNAEWLRARHAEWNSGSAHIRRRGAAFTRREIRPAGNAGLLMDLGFDPDERRRVGWNRRSTRGASRFVTARNSANRKWRSCCSRAARIQCAYLRRAAAPVYAAYGQKIRR